MKVIREIVEEIDHCFQQCPYYTVEDMEKIMRCTHPKAPHHGFIIYHPTCDNGFPPLCPLTGHS